jgi:F0F1-type ATP synthase assembly protein I
MKDKSPRNTSNQDLIRYAGLGTQILAALGLAVFAGLKGDKWLHTSPLLVCILPLLILFVIFYKLMKETARKDSDDKTNKR